MGRHKKEENIVEPTYFPPPSEDDLMIDSIIRSIPSWETCYAKVYKSRPLPTGAKGAVLMGEIPDLHGISDLESYVRNLARDNNWGIGGYLVTIFQKKGNISQDKINLPIEISYDEKPVISTTKQPDFKEQLKENAEFLKSTKELVKEFLPQQPAMNQTDIIKSQVDAFRSGIEAQRSVTPSPTIPTSENQFLDALKFLKESGMLKESGNGQEMQMLQTLRLLKEMGLISQPGQAAAQEKDLFSEIAKLKEVGLIKLPADEKPEDTMSSVSKVMELVSALTPLLGGLGGEKTSATIELIRVLGPQVPKIVENITGTINQVAEVSKMKISAKMGLRPHELAKLAEKKIERIENVKAESIQSQPERIEPQMSKERNPLIQELLLAVENNDQEFFPRLEELMITYIGPHIFDVLIDGSISVDTFLNSFSHMVSESSLISEKSKVYLSTFLEWYQRNETIAKCTTCNAEFTYENQQAFEEDTKLCDCGGTLQLQIGTK